MYLCILRQYQLQKSSGHDGEVLLEMELADFILPHPRPRYDKTLRREIPRVLTGMARVFGEKE